MASDKKKDKDKDENEFKKKDRNKLKAEYMWWFQMAENDPTGSFKKMLQEFQTLLTDPKAEGAFQNADEAASWMTREMNENEWWRSLTKEERESYREQYNPETAANYLDNVQDRSDLVANRARILGFDIDPGKLQEIAVQAQREGWTDLEVDAALRPLVALDTDGYGGALGEASQNLSSWSSRNGFTIEQSSMDSMLASVAFGDKTIDQVKQELRQTYMLGAYPAWADQINAGIDIYDLASPYRSVAQRMLGRSDLAMNDPIMQQMMQVQGADGSWTSRPLWEAERYIRNTDEWQGTDDAAETYAKGMSAVSAMFGFG